MTWSDAAMATLKTLWLAGESASYIARQLGDGVTRASVIGKVHRLGLTRRPGVTRGPATVSRVVHARPAPAVAVAPRPEAVAALKAADQMEADVDPDRFERAKPLLERGERECCWPLGAPDPVRGQLFCCAPTAFRKSYCGEHGTSDGKALKAIRPMSDPRVQRPRRERPDSDAELTELLA
ncbi:GcrA family cell cycle regulator [uncultured Brevundimonas sp.]|uniref:GcrA family cell cycle regulator n=1 Tax=uncultured Brevundimonas sp. TaxID=213418 RepID=UPI0026237F19|nr:GcrA family cell cycle regulator [uncultured Brevundimonas sp.]